MPSARERYHAAIAYARAGNTDPDTPPSDGANYSLDTIFPRAYIVGVDCEIEVTDEFTAWWNSLTADEQESVAYSVDLLEAKGVALGHPHTSQVHGSKHGHMRELRVQHQGRPYRVLYAFDPRRMALLLIGGDKGSTGDRWYDVFIPIADSLYDEHLKEIARDTT